MITRLKAARFGLAALLALIPFFAAPPVFAADPATDSEPSSTVRTVEGSAADGTADSQARRRIAAEAVAAQAWEIPSGNGSISGTITVPGASAADISRLKISANYSFFGKFQGGLIIMGEAAVTSPDSKGRFSLSGLGPGFYSLEFRDPTGMIAHDVAYGMENMIEVGEGQALSGKDLVTTLAGWLAGKVSVPAGYPLDKVRVALYRVNRTPNEFNSRLWEEDIPVGTDGSYRIGGLPAGAWLPFFSAPSTNLMPLYYRDSPSSAAATDVLLKAGQTAALDTVALSKGGAISGRVVGRDGSPAGAGIDVLAGFSELPGSSTTTRADGTFTLEGLGTGTFILSVIDYTNGLGAETYSGDTMDLGSALKATSRIGRDTYYGAIRLGGSASFADVPQGTQFFSEIGWLAGKGVSTGWVEQGRALFRPGQPVNRDAMAAFMYRLAGSPAFDPPAVSPFADVTRDTQFYKEITWLAAQKISTGWNEGGGRWTYRPLQPVNRDAMAAFMYRFAGSPPYTAPPAVLAPFSDVPAGTQFYKEIGWLSDNRISTGWVNGWDAQFKPTAEVKRDAMAAFMYRLDLAFGRR
ncbi:S-layer homology domain-containing protein [Pseudarthrobacter sp. L19]|uniref:carboxypeptidase-like regulatory domain-containing protein n=1 Tax=Pseudarthrobacter sp. L19 TaxID=3423951 RepID=UPI003D7BBC54